MTVYRYRLQYRPLGPGAVPKGFLPNHELWRDPTVKPAAEGEPRFGWLDYPHELGEEADRYELIFEGALEV